MQTYLTSLNSWCRPSPAVGLEAEALNEAIGSYQDLMTNIAAYLSKALPDLLNFGYAIGSGVISGITALISSVYMLAGKGRLVPQIKKMLYAILPRRRADWLLGVCGHTNRVVVGFINGKLIDSAIIGVLCFILCLIFRIPYPMLVSVVVGVTNIIPFFGPIIGAIPCLMILVIVDPWAALRFFALVIGLQQFDGNILGPKILGAAQACQPSGCWFPLWCAAACFGFPGMVLECAPLRAVCTGAGLGQQTLGTQAPGRKQEASWTLIKTE